MFRKFAVLCSKISMPFTSSMILAPSADNIDDNLIHIKRLRSSCKYHTQLYHHLQVLYSKNNIDSANSGYIGA